MKAIHEKEEVSHSLFVYSRTFGGAEGLAKMLKSNVKVPYKYLYSL
jgi:hypothetical protein